MVSCAFIPRGFGFGSSWSVAELSRPCISDSPAAVLKSEQAVGRDGWLLYRQGSNTAVWISRWHSAASHGPQTIGTAPLPALFQMGGLWRENGICLFCNGLSSSAFRALGLLFPSERHFPAVARDWRWAQPPLVCCFMIYSDLVIYTTLLLKLSPISHVEWEWINTIISDTSWSYKLLGYRARISGWHWERRNAAELICSIWGSQSLAASAVSKQDCIFENDTVFGINKF